MSNEGNEEWGCRRLDEARASKQNMVGPLFGHKTPPCAYLDPKLRKYDAVRVAMGS